MVTANAVVVGGATGIGAGLCRALAQDGYGCDIVDFDVEHAEALGAELGAAIWPADITRRAVMQATADAIVARRGTIDLLFANAGAIVLKPFLDASEEDWRWLTEVNIAGTVNTIHAFLPYLLAQPCASRIVITCSVSVLRTAGIAGQSLYVATKAAQLGLFTALERELHGTNVSPAIVFPGPVRTELRAKSARAHAGAIDGGCLPPGAMPAGMIDGAVAGRRILDAVLARQRFIATHKEERDAVAARLGAIVAAFD